MVQTQRIDRAVVERGDRSRDQRHGGSKARRKTARRAATVVAEWREFMKAKVVRLFKAPTSAMCGAKHLAPYKMTVHQGRDQKQHLRPGNRSITFVFDTEAELRAFCHGAHFAAGWDFEELHDGVCDICGATDQDAEVRYHDPEDWED